MRKKNTIFLLLFFFFFLGFFGKNILAQQDEIRFFIGPAISEPQLEKGEVYESKIIIRNKNNFPVPIKSRIVNFNARDEFGAILFEKAEGADWFFVKEPDFILQANEEKWIDFEIKVPENAKRGGYYVSWVFEPKIPSQYLKGTSTPAIPQLASLFLISVGKRGGANFEIIEMKVPEEKRILFLEKILKNFKKEKNFFVVKDANVPFSIRVKNNDVYHVKPSGTLKFIGPLNSVIGEAEIKETTILPGKIRQISVNFKPKIYVRLDKYAPEPVAEFFSGNFFLGNYKALLALHGSAEVFSESSILVIPFFGILITLLLLLILIFLIILKRKQKKKKRSLKSKKS